MSKPTGRCEWRVILDIIRLVRVMSPSQREAWRDEGEKLLNQVHVDNRPTSLRKGRG